MFEEVELGQEIAKEDYEAALPDLRVGLVNAQYDLRGADFPLIVLVGGNDATGIRDALNEMNEWMDARYVAVHLFGPPTREESERPRSWRYWNVLPRDGETCIYVGAWATALITERAEKEVDAAEFERRCAQIQSVEHAWVADGALLIKFWLHLPKKALKKRRSKHDRDGDTAWGIDAAECWTHAKYDDTRPIVERYLTETGTRAAPWTLIESTDRHHRNLTIARTILAQLGARLATRTATDSTQPAPQALSAKHAVSVVEASAAAKTPTSRSVLDAVDLSLTLTDERYEDELERHSAELARLSARAVRKRVSTILVFEGWDAAGKGGAIRRLTRAIDLANYRVVAISAPTEEERAHHYMWRFWRRLPPLGRVSIFDRSWYGRVLVERVEGFATPSEWQRAYSEINEFEDELIEHDTVLCKFWLHISHAEQMRRFEAREQTPYKKYKITVDDYRNRAKRPQYEAAVTDMVARTSTERAPWVLIPANDKRWARIRVFESVCDALEARL